MTDVVDLPCPFCGGSNTVAGGDDKVCGIYCRDCGAGGPNGYQSKLTRNDRARLSQAGAGGGVVDALRKIAEEAKRANDVIRLNRDGGGQGRVKVATAMHRISKWADAALAPSPSASPGHTDLMVTPESIDAFLEANPPPATPVQPTASVEGVRVALDCAQWLELILAETGWKEPEGEQHIAASIARARALTPAPTQGGGSQQLLDKALNVLERCHTVLFNMAKENEGAIFNRWPIHHEPLRSDARNLLPLIDEVLGHD